MLLGAPASLAQEFGRLASIHLESDGSRYRVSESPADRRPPAKVESFRDSSLKGGILCVRKCSRNRNFLRFSRSPIWAQFGYRVSQPWSSLGGTQAAKGTVGGSVGGIIGDAVKLVNQFRRPVWLFKEFSLEGG